MKLRLVLCCNRIEEKQKGLRPFGERKNNMPQLSWDSILLVFLVVGTGLGFLLRKARIITMCLGIYLAYILASELGIWITRALRAFLNSDINLFYLKLTIFIITVVMLATEEYFLNNQVEIPVGIKANFEGALYGFMMSGLFLSQVFELMDAARLMETQSSSVIAGYIVANRIFFVVIPIILISITGFLRRFKIIG